METVEIFIIIVSIVLKISHIRLKTEHDPEAKTAHCHPIAYSQRDIAACHQSCEVLSKPKLNHQLN